MSALAERLAKLSPEKRRLLERRLAREGLGRDVSRAVARRDPGDAGPFPLTFGMQRLWFVDRLAPGSTAYNIPFAGRLAGPLDPGALAAAFREVVRRHEVLRTTFPAVDGRPVQAIGPPPARVAVPVIDLSALPAGRRDAEAARRVDADPQVPFDLARGPMFRVSLVRLAAGDHWLLVTMPHIVTDAWSMAVLFRELPPLYEAARRGEASPLAEPPIQVADFALWQHRFLAGPVSAEQAEFWRRHLAGAPRVLELPTDRPRPPLQDLRGRRHYRDLSPEEYAAVKRLAERLDATAFMVLLAAWNLLVWRWTGERDQLVGTPIATRPQPESHGLIGFFIDNAVLRTRLAGAASFAELVARVKESALATFANGDLPFDRVLEALGVARDLSRPPLVQLNFVLQNVHIPEPEFRDLAVLASQQTDARAARFELTVGMFDWHGGLRCGFEYAVALWERPTIARMAGHFATLLREAAADPARPLDALPMLAAEERRQLLAAARGEPGAAAGLRTGRTVWELIEEAARRRPRAVAVGAGDGGPGPTYRELALRVRRTAARLLAAGLGPEEPVAVLAARSPEGVVALLAALAAGAAYLPLDPALPAERLRRLAADAGARLLLDATGGAGPELPGLVRVEAASGDEGGSSPPLPPPDPDRLAYVLYTSGSTGEPKGVAVTHGALAAIVEGWRLALGIASGDRASHLLAPGFDASLIEVLPPLAAGARLEPIAPEVVLSGPGLLAELARRRVSVMTAVPSLLAALGEGAAGALPEVRLLAVGGEALPAALAARWATGRRLFNVYGPTEAAITATLGEVESPRASDLAAPPAADGPPASTAAAPPAASDPAARAAAHPPAGGRAVPRVHPPSARAEEVDPPPSRALRPPSIGRPLPEVEAYVVGPGRRLAPVGVPGELWLGGAGLARGYRGRPAATAAAFVPHPWSRRPGERLYRTGDRVRRLADGELGFLGRLDEQVKVRGQRIEPGEVEAALAALPEVAEAAVGLWGEDGGRRRLVAWVAAARPAAPPDPEALRATLARRLPEAMVPAAIVVLPALPRAATGKVDRRALPAPPAAESGTGGAPDTPAERALAAVWRDLLGAREVGRDDDFFALGGDSIASIQMISRAAAAGIRLTPQQVFGHPRLADLARVAAEAAPPAAVPAVAWQGAVPLLPAQRWFLGLGLARPEHWNMSVAVAAEGRLDAAALARALAALAAVHPALRLRLRETADGWRQEAVSPGPPPLAVVDLGALPAERAAATADRAAARLQRGLDLARRPWTATLFTAGAGDRLVWTAHHLLVDAVSWRVLLEDLESAYGQAAAGRAPALPPEGMPLAAWGEAVAAFAAAPAGAAARRRLRQEDAEVAALAGPPPGAREDAAAETEVETVVEEALFDAATTAALESAARAWGAGVEALVLAAVAAAFANRDGGPVLRVEVEGHGRRPAFAGDADLARTVGWLTVSDPVTLDLRQAGADDPAAAAAAVRQALAGAAARPAPWSLLRWSPGGEALAAAPPPPVVFNYLGRGLGAAGRGGVAGGLRLLRPPRPLRAAANRRPFRFEINAWIEGGRLRCHWAFGRRRRDEAAALVAVFAAAIGRAATAGGRAVRQAPPSFAQERLWFLDRLEPGNPAYHISLPVRLAGRLDRGALAAALGAVVRRHEVLRTTFPAVAGRPVQRVAPPAPVGVPLADLGALPAARRRAEARRLVLAAARRPYALAEGPLLRVLLVAVEAPAAGTAAGEWVLFLGLHHIVADGWSLSLLVREVGAFYAGARGGRPVALPEPPLQMAEHAVREQERLSGEAGAEQLAFWRRRLAGLPPALELPADRPRPPRKGYRGGSVGRTLPPELAAGLRALGREAGASLYMVLLALLEVLLARLSGQRDFAVGTPVAGRGEGDSQATIGLFLNHLVLRADLAGRPTFRDLLARVRRTTLAALAHAEVPFERVIEEVGAPRDLARTPLFQVFFNMLNFPRVEARLGAEVTLAALPGGPPLAMFDWTLYAKEQGESVHLELLYDAALFDRATAAEALAQIEALAAKAVAEPDGPVDGWSLRTAAAAAALPDPAAAQDDAWPGPVHRAVARHARRQPGRPALLAGDRVFSYGELAAATARLAHALRRAGVGRGDVVAIHGHRSPALVPAVLAAQAAGAAALVLDPEHPPARNAAAVAVARPRGWLALAAAGPPGAELAEAVAALAPAAALELPPLEEWPHHPLLGAGAGPQGPTGEANAVERLAPAEWPFPPGAGPPSAVGQPPPAERPGGGRPAAGPVDLPPVPLDAGDAAVVTFTSGSTGRPKGVVGVHRSLTHFLPWQAEAFGLGGDDRFALLSGLAHDPLQRDLFTPLWLGAALAIPDPDDLRRPGALARWMADAGVTVAHLTPALGRLLAEVPASDAGLRLPALGRAFFLGDALTAADVARLRRLAPAVGAVNLYGATETQRAVGWHAADATDDEAAAGAAVLPLGRGMPDADLLVLAGGGVAAGIGEVGEIHLRSPHLARGYLGDSAATAERFVPDPAGGGGRLYRTGDLGRYRRDGAVLPLGRADRQVKVRGVRIEPAEVEAALAAHPGVREAAVGVRGEGEARRLAAWVVAAGEAPPAAGELRDHLRRRLPEPMVPEAWVFLPALPLTPNRKVDRAALPEPAAGRRDGPAGGPPRGETEECVAAAWREVLGVAEVGRDDDFFALGGHSLKLVQVLARLVESCGVEVPVRAVFEAPTPAGMAAAVEAARRPGAAPAGPPLVAVPRRGALPATFAQRRLLFLDRLQPGSPAYNVPGAVRLAGRLETAALAAALAGLVRRHESLRTGLVAAAGEAVQEIAPPALAEGWRLPEVDLSSLPDPARRRRAEALAAAEALRPFDLARPPLFRAVLVRLAAEEHLLVLTLHHAVTDGWSMGILLADAAELYAAAVAGRAARLPALPFQVADFAAWQRRRLTPEALDGVLAYWRRALAGVPPLELPADRPRPALPAGRGLRVPLELPAGLTAAVERLRPASGATPFHVLLAAFQALMARWSGQADFAVGVPVARRPHPALERVVGFFADTLALRAGLAGDPTFAELVARVRETAIDAFAHQEAPFEAVVRAVGAERDRGRAPLFQVMFALEDVPPPVFRAPGLELAPADLPAATSRFDVTVALAPRPAGGWGGFLEADADLFDRATAERMAGRLAVLAAGLTAEPARPIGRAPLLTGGERRQLLADRRGGAAAAPATRSLPDLFAAAAAARPGAVAVSCGEERLTYAELDRRSAALARALRRRGVGTEVPVGLLVERSVGLVVAVLGVLRAGGAYVPLDPEWPSERLAEVAADAGFRALLADGATAEEAERLAGVGAIEVVKIDSAGAWLGATAGEAELPRSATGAPFAAAGSAALVAVGRLGSTASRRQAAGAPDAEQPRAAGRPPLAAGFAAVSGSGDGAASAAPAHAAPALPRVSPDQLAYVIYTSGSTGRPKGVEVTHGNVVRLLAATAAFAFGPDDVWTLFHSAAFDFSVWELWGALAYGGRVVVVPRGTARSTGDFLDLLAGEEVTVLSQTPSAFAALDAEDARRGGRDRLALRWVVFGGEELEPAALAGWFARRGDRRPALVNMYGITETTVHVTWRQLRRADAGGGRGGRSPIGVPLPDLTAAVVDRGGEAVPVGVPGELLVGGPGVARGYRGRPGLTAERFVPDPFAGPGEAGRRVYRSGDRVRWRASGELDYHGRLDQQMQIRGFRVEPGEVEAALLALPAVAAAAVVPRDDLPAGPGLVGYFVPAAGEAAVAADDLKAALRRRLPEYMVPAWLVPLAELPRTVNGKLDRRALAALPPPGGDRPELARAYEAPRTPLEEVLAAAWAEVLGVARVGRHDSFFDLGGDSLSALRAAARLREAAGVELPLGELFTTPTVAALAHRLEGARQEADGPPIVRRDGAARGLPAPASFAQERLWLLARLDPADTAYNVPVAVRLAGRLDRGALAAALATLVARHEALRTVLPERDGRPVQVVRPHAPPPLPRVDLAALPAGRRPAAVAAVLADHARRPFDLARGPLLTARLLIVAAEEHVLSLVLHHAICDEWSLAVLMGELGEAYAAAAAGRPAALPALPIQYADWAAWQRRRLDGPRLAAELAWWRGYLDGAPGRLELPADRARSPRPARRSRRVPVRLPAEAADGLLAAARAAGATPFMAAAALLAAQLHRYGGGDDLFLATPVAGRGPAATERLVGFFVNTLPLRLDLAGDPGFDRLLARVRASALAAFDHGEVPFEKLVEAAAPARAGAATPLVQAMLAFHNVRLPRMALPGLRIEPVPGAAPGAKLDLLLQLGEDAGGLGGVLEVAADLFDQATAERMAGHLAVLAAGLAAEPARPIGRAPLLTGGERRQLLADRRGGAAAAPVTRSLPDLFAAAAAARPGTVAVSCGEERLTYAELDRRSAALARELRRRGVGAEVPVGLLVERGVELVVAILGVLRAGGAYVPLDPEWPSERLAEVAADAGFRVLLAGAETAQEAARLAGDGAIDLVRIDGAGAWLDDAAGEAELPRSTTGAPFAVGGSAASVAVGRLGSTASRRQAAATPGADQPPAAGRPPLAARFAVVSGSGDGAIPAAAGATGVTGAPPPPASALPSPAGGVTTGSPRAGGVVDARHGAGRAAAAAPAHAAPALPRVSPDQLAYVIYTSGSTGRPKGVEVTHGNVVRLLAATAAFAFGPDDVWTLFHSAAFDFSVWELWGALAYGGRVVVVPRGTARSTGDFLDLLAAEQVTVLNQTPSAFIALDAEDARRGGRDRLALRWVVFGGEELEPAALAGWFARRGERRPALVNMYGITETTVHVTWRQLRRADAGDGRGGRSPIGVPLPDLTAAVVDRGGEPVPAGVPGELLVGGPGVARGYRGRPGLTAERFVPDPFAGPGEAGRRVYRSGDRVRWRASGELDYHGRLDQQVQIRGFRVEPGEVEAALRALPEVAAAAVVPRDDLPAGPGLVGYFVPAAGEAAAGADDLKAALRRRLPEYMVPAWLVPMSELPRTVNGKLDRRALAALPPPGGGRPELGRAYEAPRGPLEEVLAAAWAEALGVDRVGRRDSFFDLGGHSLLATRMVAWVRDALGAEVPLAEVFADPTVAGLAAALRAGADGAAAAERAAEALLEIGALSDEEVERLATAGSGASP